MAWGCGGPGADLFVVERSGSIPGARLTMRVGDDGTVSCNGAPSRRLQDRQLLRARELARELERPARRQLSLPPGRRGILDYRVRSPEGDVRFSDTSPRQPRVFFALAFFTREVARGVCGLPR